MRVPILNGQAVLLIADNDCVTGIEFPDYGALDNPTEPFAVTYNFCATRSFATTVAQTVLGLLGAGGAI